MLCPNWFKHMCARSVLKTLASFKPFEGSLKSSALLMGALNLLNGPSPEGRAMRVKELDCSNVTNVTW